MEFKQVVKQKVYRELELKKDKLSFARTKTFTTEFEKTALPKGKKSTGKTEAAD